MVAMANARGGQPIRKQRLDRVFEFRKLYRLREKRGGAELVGFADIAQVIAGGEDHSVKPGASGLGTNPGKELNATHAGHFEVEEQEIGQRKLTAFLKSAFASQISNGLFAIMHVLCGPAIAKYLNALRSRRRSSSLSSAINTTGCRSGDVSISSSSPLIIAVPEMGVFRQ
jgi:hypothetical protein